MVRGPRPSERGVLLDDGSQRQLILVGLEQRFRESSNEKNATLVRFDIRQSLRQLYNETKDEKIKTKALELIGTEEDLKYRSKYSSVWKTKTNGGPG